MTDSPGGSQTGSAAYTALGELRGSSTNHRYGYAGTYGYQTHDDFPFLHVGARYYDPATGRFLQRDPTGIDGGLNVYEYVRSTPTQYIDLDGAGRHKLRDPKTGRFRKTPWSRKKVGPSRFFLAY